MRENNKNKYKIFEYISETLAEVRKAHRNVILINAIKAKITLAWK